jgi:hypothetical protein
MSQGWDRPLEFGASSFTAPEFKPIEFAPPTFSSTSFDTAFTSTQSTSMFEPATFVPVTFDAPPTFSTSDIAATSSSLLADSSAFSINSVSAADISQPIPRPPAYFDSQEQTEQSEVKSAVLPESGTSRLLGAIQSGKREVFDLEVSFSCVHADSLSSKF